MFRMSCTIVVTFGVAAIVAGLPKANGDLLTLDSASFTYKYEMNNFPSDHPTVNVDGNGAADFSHDGTIGNMAVSGGILNINTPGAATNAYFVSLGAGSIWDGVSAPFKEAGYTVEIRAKVISVSPNYPDDLSTNIAVWTHPKNSGQNGLLQIAGGATLWGGRDFEPIPLDTQDNTDDFHTFRYVQLPNPSGNATFSVWRDGVLIGSDLVPTEVNSAPQWLIFGDLQGIHQGVTDVDYLRFTEGAWAPVPEPVTISMLSTGIICLSICFWKRHKSNTDTARIS